ncbi:MAG: hypothetical protein ACKO5L_04795, partial [Bacteroidota bacterium]
MMKFKLILFLLLCFQFESRAQGINNLLSTTPREYEIGPIRVIGADNFDHQAIKAVAGLRQGQMITLPGDQISRAIRNLW